MAWGVRPYLVGSILLGLLGSLAGCSGGGWFAEREPWRHEAELECINTGSVQEGEGVTRVKAIQGPGVCGAQFPLRVASLGDGTPLGYFGDPRPPAAIPGRSSSPRWPIRDPAPDSAERTAAVPSPSPSTQRWPRRPQEPIALDPPSSVPPPGYDRPDLRAYRAGRVQQTPLEAFPREDFSPVPYEHRALIDTGAGSATPPPPRHRASPGEPQGAHMDRKISHQAISARGVSLGTARGSTGGARPNMSIGPVSFSPPATLACPIVSALDQWLSNSVQPAAMRWFGTPVAEITQISAYSCRGMNGNPRARISEHSFGNALDIAAFTLADGRKVTVKGGWRGLPEEQGFLRDIQASACDQFTTVLAPGSDAFHYDHFHLDLMRRGSGHRACNPEPTSGEHVAARAGARHAGQRPDLSPTGSLPQRPTSRRLGFDADALERLPALPLAEPGNDGED
jgi:hypothetical protein